MRMSAKCHAYPCHIHSDIFIKKNKKLNRYIYLVKLTNDMCFMNTEGVSYFDTIEATRS